MKRRNIKVLAAVLLFGFGLSAQAEIVKVLLRADGLC